MPTPPKTDTAPVNPFTNLAFAKLALETNKAFPGKFTEKQVKDAKETVGQKTTLVQRENQQKVMAQLSSLAGRDHEFSHTVFKNKSCNTAYAQFTYDQGLYYVPFILHPNRPDQSDKKNSKANLAHLQENCKKTEELFTNRLHRLEFLAAEQKKHESQDDVKKVLHRTFRKAKVVEKERQDRALNRTLTSKAEMIAAYHRIQVKLIDLYSQSNVINAEEQFNAVQRAYEVVDAIEKFNQTQDVYELDLLHENSIRGNDLIRHPDSLNS